mgnify:CR=1 FL=1
MYKNKRFIVLGTLLLVSLVLFDFVLKYNEDRGRLYARQGILDISSIQFDDNSKYLLSGEWEVYDKLLLKPEEIEGNLSYMTYMTEGRQSIDSHSHSRTYRLKIFSTELKEIGILIPDISAFKLWINNSLIMDYKLENKNAVIRRMNMVLISGDQYRIVPGGYEIEVVLAVQDRISYRERPIKLMIGNSAALENTQNINLVLNTLAIGCYILVAIYSFSLFVKKRSEEYLLYLGFLALNNILANSLDSNILSVIPIFNIRTEGWIKLINMATLFIPIFIFMVCNKLFYGSLAGKKQKLFLVVSSSLAIIIALLPLELTLFRGNLSLYLVRVIVPINFLVIISAFLQGKCNTLIMAGGILFFEAFIFEVMINTGFIDVGMLSVYINTSQYAYLLFTILIVLTVANKFAKKFDEAEILSGQLDYMNKNLVAMVDEKTVELKNSYNQILNLQKQRHNLLLNISHDLRSPLFVIKGYIEAINEDMVKDKETLYKYIKRIEVKTDYLSGLIEDLFLVAKLEDNKIKFNMVEFDLASLIEQVINDSKTKAAKKDIQISFQKPIHAVLIEGDKNRLHQVIDNVIGNSLKFTHEKGNIDVRVWEEQQKACISIQDDGIGIAEEDLQHIFERYYRAMKKDAYAEESTGLGLYISREIVEKHGGRIWAESKEAEGTIVHIELPVRDNGSHQQKWD